MKSTVFVDERGESLVEILVALAIIAIVITAFLAALSTGTFGVGVVRKRVTAENLARAQLEYVKDYEPYKEVTQTTPGAYPTVTSIVSGYAITVTASPITTTNYNIQLITVTVFHNSKPVFMIEDYKVKR